MTDSARTALREHLPELFDFARARADWDADWIVISILDVESTDLDIVEEEAAAGKFENLQDDWLDDPRVPAGQHRWPNAIDLPQAYAPGHVNGADAPGSPMRYDSPPPPDALAFYLPFHYFPEETWGVYLTYEGVSALAEYLISHPTGQITRNEAMYAARLFLYGHEAFHHAVESLATRLEVDRRVPLYRCGFEQLYRRQLAADSSLEEALATGFGVQKAVESARRHRWSSRKLAALGGAFHDYVLSLPPNYRSGIHFFDKSEYEARRNDLAEQSRAECLGGHQLSGEIWRNAPHAFRGTANIASRTNYIVHRNSSLAQRNRLHLRFFRRKEVVEKLQRLAQLRFDREGSRHELWRTRTGQSVSIPRHRDIPDGTVRGILKQCGLEMSLEKFRVS